MNYRILVGLILLLYQTTSFPVNTSTNYLVNHSLLLDATYTGKSCVAVGEHGVILSSDDCRNWKLVPVSVTSTLTAVFFINPESGWAVGHDAVILKTVDGGVSWKQVYSAAKDEAPLLDVYFMDEQHGLAVGAYGQYLQTDDGGASWQKKNFLALVSNSQSAQNLMPDLHLNSVNCDNNDVCYITAEAGHIFRSRDQGASWESLESPYSGSLFGLLALTDNHSLLVYGLRGHLYRSDDNGDHWIKIITHTRESLTNAIETVAGEIYICGMGGVVLHSQDFGDTFFLTINPDLVSYSAVIETPDNNLLLTGEQGINYPRQADLVNSGHP